MQEVNSEGASFLSPSPSPPPSRTILITGVSKGLGRALALELAKRGHTIIIGCSRDHNKLQSLQTELSSPHNHFLLTADVSSNINMEELARAVKERKLVPDIIVNNAGVINKKSKLWEMGVEEFDSIIDINLKGTANVIRNFIPLMIQTKKKGLIVNMSSGWGTSEAPMFSAYSASKWGVEGLTKSIAKELPEGITILALQPGIINTNMLVTCIGNDLASQYPNPQPWAIKASQTILDLTAADNGASLTIEY